MTEQLNIFEFEPYEENQVLINASIEVLQEKGFTYLLPLGTSKKGNSAFKGIFENKGCIVHIDSDGYIIAKHDDSRFWDAIGSV